MRSIRRGSDDWKDLLRPFVSNLVHRCLMKRRSESDYAFVPYNTDAAVMFVDLSGYSRISAFLANKGAHVLSTVVNEYMTRLLHVVQQYGGDVVKFAGDAILIVWEGSQKDLACNVHCAAKCALQMQRNAGCHPIEGTGLEFRIHIGLCCGQIETDIFVAPRHTAMQRLYHAVGGEPLLEIGDLVDMAKSGEICISAECAEFLGSAGTYQEANPNSDAKLLLRLSIDAEQEERIDDRVDQLIRERDEYRNVDIAEDFVHRSILKMLLHSGNLPTQIAQMRNLCVLFIAMTSSANPVNWLMEVQGVLDTHRCPIVQIIDDDKGVHVVAAVNLYESVPEASSIALDACRVLQDKQVGCAIGMAMGSTFCGVTGCSTIACRWDITGPPAVRAARLMQYAVGNGLPCAIDQSVYDNTTASALLEVLDAGVYVKGSKDAISIFTVTDGTHVIGPMILESFALAPVHQEAVEKITSMLFGRNTRGAVIVTGPPNSGKKCALQRAAGLACVVPVLHTCDAGAGHLQLAKTVASWFLHCRHQDLRDFAQGVSDHMDQQRWSRAHDECIALLNHVIARGYRICFVVDRAQFLDDFSLSMMRECLDDGQRRKSIVASQSSSIRSSVTSSTSSVLSWESLGSNSKGKVFFLCSHIPLYHGRTANCVVHELKRTRTFDVPIIKIGSVTKEELRECIVHSLDMNATDEWLRVYGEMSGYKVGYFYQRVHALRVASSKLIAEGHQGLSTLRCDVTLFIPPHMTRRHRSFKVMDVDASSAMRYSQQYDDLPPRHQIFMKVVALATCRRFFTCPKLVVREAMDDLIDEGIEESKFSIIVKELVDTYMIETEGENLKTVVRISCPALADVIMDSCTPLQVETISIVLIERLEPFLHTTYKVPLACAALAGSNGMRDRQRDLWKQSYQQLIASGARQSDVSDMQLLEDEILDAGGDPREVLGASFHVQRQDHTQLDKSVMFIKNYKAPISYGPMGHSFNVICRNVYDEIRLYHNHMPLEVERLHRESRCAYIRFCFEVKTIEQFLSDEGFGIPDEEISAELALVEGLVVKSHAEENIFQKAATITGQLVTQHTNPRLQRLYQVAEKLRTGEVPPIISSAAEPIRLAYEAMRTLECRNDAVQHALATLSNLNWMPTSIPEHLPLFYYHTVARLRTAVLRRLTPAELHLFKHQHSVDDLEVFLLTTAILVKSHEQVCLRYPPEGR